VSSKSAGQLAQIAERVEQLAAGQRCDRARIEYLEAEVASERAGRAQLELALAAERSARELLEARVSALEGRRGPRDERDRELLAVLARRIGSRKFTSLQLLAHGRADPEVAHAMAAADLTTPQEIGCVLRRLKDATIDGRTIRREGRRWWVHVVHVDVQAEIEDRLPP